MLLGRTFERFVEKAPVAVMARGVLDIPLPTSQ